MEAFKIELFESEHKLSFPKFRTLTVQECQALRKGVIDKYMLNSASIEHDIVSKQLLWNGGNALNEFKLTETMDQIGIKPNQEIFLNWYKFEEVDSFQITAVDRYFEDIWFPGSDDIDVMDTSMDWILSIRHDGCVSYLKSY